MGGFGSQQNKYGEKARNTLPGLEGAHKCGLWSLPRGWRRGLKSYRSLTERRCSPVPELEVSSVGGMSGAGLVLAGELAWLSLGKVPERPGSEETGGFTGLASSLGESDLADTISPHQLGRNLVLCGEVKSSLGSGEYSQVSQHTELLVRSADRGKLASTIGNYRATRPFMASSNTHCPCGSLVDVDPIYPAFLLPFFLCKRPQPYWNWQ